jgi:hypothetical protein
MITEKDLTKTQRKYFKSEYDDEQREIVLHALNRKPIHKELSTGLIIDAHYDYKYGMITLKASITLSDKVIWKGEYSSPDMELSLDGYETKGELIDTVYEMLWNDISDDEHGYNRLKKLLGK